MMIRIPPFLAALLLAGGLAGAQAATPADLAAACAACHPQADRGDFDEHRIRNPH
jgi:cytochrome c553